mgnify:CR=1 FL=1
MSLLNITNKELISIYNAVVKIYSGNTPNRSIVKMTEDEKEFYAKKVVYRDKKYIEDEMVLLSLEDSKYRLLFILIKDCHEKDEESLHFFPTESIPSIFKNESQDIIIPIDNRLIQNGESKNITTTIFSIFTSIISHIYNDNNIGVCKVSQCIAYLFTAIIFNIENPELFISDSKSNFLKIEDINNANIYISKLFSAGCIAQSSFINSINVCLLNSDSNATIGIIRDYISKIYMNLSIEEA